MERVNPPLPEHQRDIGEHGESNPRIAYRGLKWCELVFCGQKWSKVTDWMSIHNRPLLIFLLLGRETR
jgi:hypothetical protein